MRRIMWIIVLVVLASIVGTAGVQAQEEFPIYGLISVDPAEVRAGPDFAYPSIGQLPLNASVVVLGRAGQFYSSWDGRQWLQIEYGDRNAWIYARLVRTSEPFNSIPVRGMMLPRDRNGRVPDVFDLSTYICEGWQGDFTRSGDFMSGASELTVTFPVMPGATIYSVIVFTPTGYRIAFDTETTTATIELQRLPYMGGTYTWRVAPYWTTGTERWRWQQICPLQTGGTFDKPET